MLASPLGMSAVVAGVVAAGSTLGDTDTIPDELPPSLLLSSTSQVVVVAEVAAD